MNSPRIRQTVGAKTVYLLSTYVLHRKACFRFVLVRLQVFVKFLFRDTNLVLASRSNEEPSLTTKVAFILPLKSTFVIDIAHKTVHYNTLVWGSTEMDRTQHMGTRSACLLALCSQSFCSKLKNEAGSSRE